MTLVLFSYDDSTVEKYPLPSNTKTMILNKNKRRALGSLIRVLREINPDIVLSTLGPINILCMMAKVISRAKARFVIRETTIKSVSIQNSKTSPITRFLYCALVKMFYRFADSVIALSEGARIDLVSNFGVDERQISVIYNPVDIGTIQHESREPVGLDFRRPGRYAVATVGSLVKSKGHRYLIQALEILNFRDGLDVDAYFIGDGRLKSELLTEVEHRNLHDRVHFLGFKANPHKYVRNCDVFVLPALWEGFGNVIVEAMVCGTPVISTNCESGPKEIITHNHDGLLVEPRSVERLAESIRRLLTDSELCSTLSRNALKRVQDFDSRKIVKQYENHILFLMNRSRSGN